MLDKKEIFKSSKDDWKEIKSSMKLFFEKTFKSKLIKQFM